MKSYLVKAPFSATYNFNNKKLVKSLIHTFFTTPSRSRSKIAGTDAINIGFNKEASHMVHFLILFDQSVKVSVEP